MPSHSRERVIPSGTIELVINLHEDEFRIGKSVGTGEECARFRGAIVSGAYGGPFVFVSAGHFCDPRVRRYVVPEVETRTIVNQTRIVNNLTFEINGTSKSAQFQ